MVISMDSQYFKTVFLEIQNVTTWSVFPNQITYVICLVCTVIQYHRDVRDGVTNDARASPLLVLQF